MDKKGNLEIEGLYNDIWKVIEKRLNFSTLITKMKEDNWSGMINSVVDKKHDILLSGNSLTEYRSRIVDLSFPIVPTSIRLIYTRRMERPKWLFYLKSFPLESWISTICMAFITFFIYVGLQMGYEKVCK